MNKTKLMLPIITLLFLLQSCGQSHIADVNMSIEENNWLYNKNLITEFDITNNTVPYRVNFKLRHTNDYRYSNLYIVMRLTGNGINQKTRYQFKLAKADGQWIGKGSGDVYTYTFPLLKDFRFAKTGKYKIEIEQNMRDNPLTGISDIGLVVTAK